MLPPLGGWGINLDGVRRGACLRSRLGPPAAVEPRERALQEEWPTPHCRSSLKKNQRHRRASLQPVNLGRRELGSQSTGF